MARAGLAEDSIFIKRLSDDGPKRVHETRNLGSGLRSITPQNVELMLALGGRYALTHVLNGRYCRSWRFE